MCPFFHLQVLSKGKLDILHICWESGMSGNPGCVRARQGFSVSGDKDREVQVPCCLWQREHWTQAKCRWRIWHASRESPVVSLHLWSSPALLHHLQGNEETCSWIPPGSTLFSCSVLAVLCWPMSGTGLGCFGCWPDPAWPTVLLLLTVLWRLCLLLLCRESLLISTVTLESWKDLRLAFGCFSL